MSKREGPVRKFLNGSGPVRNTLRRGLLGQELGTPIVGELNDVLRDVDSIERAFEQAEIMLRHGNLRGTEFILADIARDVGNLQERVKRAMERREMLG